MRKVVLGFLAGICTSFFFGGAILGQQGIAASPAVSGGETATANTTTCSKEQEAANRKIIEKYDPTPEALKIMHPDYIQYNPEIRRFAELNGVKGLAVFELQREARARLGLKPVAPQMRGNPHYMIIAECDMIVVMRQMFEPDPQNPGKTYEAFNFDVWRMKDGQFYEHWDNARISEPVPEYLKTPVKDMKPLKN